MKIVVPEAEVYNGHCDNKYNRLSKAILSKCRGLWPFIKDVTVAPTDKGRSLYGLSDDNSTYCAIICYDDGKCERWLLSHKRQELMAALDSGNSFSFHIEPETAFLPTYYVKVLRDDLSVRRGICNRKHGRVLEATEKAIGCKLFPCIIVNDAGIDINLYKQQPSDTVAYVQSLGRKFRLNIQLYQLTKLLDSGEEFTFVVTEVSNNKNEKENDINSAKNNSSIQHEDTDLITGYRIIFENSSGITTQEEWAKTLEDLMIKINNMRLAPNKQGVWIRVYKETTKQVITRTPF